MSDYTIKLSEDEVIVLFEYFSRFDETNSSAFEHASEYLSLQKLAGLIYKTTAAMFKANYDELLAQARVRIAKGFDGDVPGLSEKT